MFNHLPKATQALLWINGGLLLLKYFINLQYNIDPQQDIMDPQSPFAVYALWPLAGGQHSFMPWQLVTYAFLHADLNHIFFNMLALLMFGAPLEYTWGTNRFLQYYFVCVLGAGLTYLAWAAVMQIQSPVIGASGGIFGLLLAYGMLFPKQRVMLLFPPIPMDARTLVIGYGVVELLMGVTGLGGNIAHFAHLGGMLFGWLMIRYWRGQPPFRKPPRGGGIRR